MPIYHFSHPVVGPLDLHVDRFPIPGTEGQLLIVHHADPGSPTERALRRLSELAEASGPTRSMS